MSEEDIYDLDKRVDEIALESMWESMESRKVYRSAIEELDELGWNHEDIYNFLAELHLASLKEEAAHE